jgi:hypothetical protein
VTASKPKKPFERHGHATGGRTPEYSAYKSMVARCYIASATGFAEYGGRGITVC